MNGPFLDTFLQKTADSNMFFIQLSTDRGRGDQVDQREQFVRDRDDLISEVINNIRGRFPQMDLMDAMQVYYLLQFLKMFIMFLFGHRCHLSGINGKLWIYNIHIYSLLNHISNQFYLL